MGDGGGMEMTHSRWTSGAFLSTTAIALAPATPMPLLLSLPSGREGRHDVAYAWRNKKELVTIPTVGADEMGNGAKWSRGATLIVCGEDTGHRAHGKMLISLKV